MVRFANNVVEIKGWMLFNLHDCYIFVYNNKQWTGKSLVVIIVVKDWKAPYMLTFPFLCLKEYLTEIDDGGGDGDIEQIT